MRGVLVDPLPYNLTLELPILVLFAGHLMPWRLLWSLVIDHNLVWLKPWHLTVSGEKTSSVQPSSFALLPTPLSISLVNQLPRGYCQLLFMLPAAEVIISFGEFLFPKFSQSDILSNQHLSFVWSYEWKWLSGVFRMLVPYRTWYWTGSFHFRIFCLFFKESSRYMSNTTITSSTSFVRFKMLILKHAMISFTVSTDDTFW